MRISKAVYFLSIVEALNKGEKIALGGLGAFGAGYLGHHLAKHGIYTSPAVSHADNTHGVMSSARSLRNSLGNTLKAPLGIPRAPILRPDPLPTREFLRKNSRMA